MEQNRETMIPLIIPNFNQVTYLKNLVNWWQWYYKNPIVIIDNASNNSDLADYYTEFEQNDDCEVVMYPVNKCADNLRVFLKHSNIEYYVISDPDIMPHPKTPPNFLEVFKHLIDEHGFHHAGFGLITDDIPDWNEQKAFLSGVENDFKKPEQEYKFTFKGVDYVGHRAPIDTTFAMYTNKNSGWHAPMDGKDWGNSIRIFEAFHLPWYQHPDYINEEMDNYFKTVKYWGDVGGASAGVNHYRPTKYNK